MAAAAQVLNQTTHCKTGTFRMEGELHWVICNFASVCAQEDLTSLISPTFHAGNDEDVPWQLQFYPNGDSEESKGAISVYLLKLQSSSKTIENLNVTYSIAIGEKSAGSKGFREGGGSHTFQSGASDHGFPALAQQQAVLSGKFLQNGDLTIVCKLAYDKENHQVVSSGPLESYYLNPPSTASVSSKFGRDMEKMFISMPHSDLVFIVDGKELPAHKAILSSRSSVFEAMFDHPDLKENQLNRVDIEDVKPEVFQALLRFIYTDRVDLKDVETSKDLLIAANRYLLQLLKFRCEKVLIQRLTTANCSEMLLLADTHNAPHLKTTTTDFIRRNMAAVMKSNGWKDLKTAHPGLIIDILESVVDSKPATY